MTGLRKPALILLLFFSFSAKSQPQGQKDTVVVSTEDSVVVASDDTTVTSGSIGNTGSLTTDRSDDYRLRHLSDNKLRDWRRDPVFAYANDPAYWTREKNQPITVSKSRSNAFERFLGSDAFRYLIYFLLASVLLYAVIRIMADNNVRLFYRSPRKKKTLEQTEEVEISELDLEGQLQHFIQVNDHRQATRYLYLIALRSLDQRGLIKWHIQTTNQQYLQQLGGSAYETSFRYLTNAFERVWYGEFPLDGTQFQRLHRYFEDFYKTLRP
jgi:hypothetical protein